MPTRVECPCCGHTAPEFAPVTRGAGKRKNAQCQVCGSRERHRLQNLFFRTMAVQPDSAVLIVSLEPYAKRYFRYVRLLETLDLYQPEADIKADVCKVPRPRAAYDVILCNHVLEHVPNDRAAIAELHRLLKPTGWAMITVPVHAGRKTYEDATIVDPKARAAAFGQDDHVRICGDDYYERLKVGGFQTTIMNFARRLTPAVRECFVVGGSEIVVCRKS